VHVADADGSPDLLGQFRGGEVQVVAAEVDDLAADLGGVCLQQQAPASAARAR
jgi:hypothetical protein